MFFDLIPTTGFICAHRGARSIAPENTILALEKAYRAGAHAWETDIRRSADGELVIFHDYTLERTSDVKSRAEFLKRQPWRTSEFTFAELKRLDVGSWFLEDDPFGTVAKGEISEEEFTAIRHQKIPRLADVLHFSATHHFPVNLEIKDQQTPVGDVAIVDQVLDLIEKTNTRELVLLSSFRHEYLYRIRKKDPEIPVAVLSRINHPANLIHYLKTLSATAYHPDYEITDPALINHLQQEGFRVNLWTVNTRRDAEKFLQSGAGIITDWPQAFAKLPATKFP